jgi:hypothetical protein
MPNGMVDDTELKTLNPNLEPNLAKSLKENAKDSR